MDSTGGKLKTRKYVEVLYDPDLQNWNEVIEQELRRRGIRHGQVTLIVRPKKAAPPAMANIRIRNKIERGFNG